MAVKAGEAFVEILSVTKGFERGLDRAQRQLRTFGKNVAKIGVAITGMATALGATIFTGVKLFADFETSLAKVGTLIDGDTKLMEEFGRAVEGLSVKFGASTGEIAAALFDIVSASVPATKATQVLTEAVKLAKVGFTDVQTAARAITRIMNTYGDAAGSAADISDFLFLTAKRGVVTFEELAQSIGGVAGTAGATGLRLNEFGAALAAITKVEGVEVSVTLLRNALLSFAKTTDGATKLAGKLGLQLDLTALQSKGLLGIMEELKDLPPDVISRLFPEKRAARAITALSQNFDQFKKVILEFENKTGTVEARLKDVLGTLTEFTKRVKEVGLAILRAFGVGLADSLKVATAGIINFLKGVNDTIRGNLTLVKTITKIVLVIGVAGVAITTLGVAIITFGIGLSILGTVFTTVASAAAFLSAALATLSAVLAIQVSFLGIAVSAAIAFFNVLGLALTPIGLVVVAIAGIGIALFILTDILESVVGFFKDGFASIFSFVKNTFSEIIARVKKGDIEGAMSVLTQNIKLFWFGVLDDITDRINNFIDTVRNFATKASLLFQKGAIAVVTFDTDNLFKELDALDEQLKRTVDNREKASRDRLNDIVTEGQKERGELDKTRAARKASDEEAKKSMEDRGKEVEKLLKMTEDQLAGLGSGGGRGKEDTIAAERIFTKTRTALEKIKIEMEQINNLISKGVNVGLEDAFDRRIKQLNELRQKTEDALSGATAKKEAGIRLVEETRTPLEEVQSELERLQTLIGTFGDDETEDAIARKIEELQSTRDDLLSVLSGETEREKLGERIFKETRTPLERVQAELKQALALVGKFADESINDAIQRKIKELKERRNDIVEAAAAPQGGRFEVAGGFAGVQFTGGEEGLAGENLKVSNQIARNTKDIKDNQENAGGVNLL